MSQKVLDVLDHLQIERLVEKTSLYLTRLWHSFSFLLFLQELMDKDPGEYELQLLELHRKKEIPYNIDHPLLEPAVWEKHFSHLNVVELPTEPITPIPPYFPFPDPKVYSQPFPESSPGSICFLTGFDTRSNLRAVPSYLLFCFTDRYTPYFGLKDYTDFFRGIPCVYYLFFLREVRETYVTVYCYRFS